MTIYDPDVVFTDLGLAIIGGYLAWRLAKRGRGGGGDSKGDFLTRAGVTLMAGLASAAFFGAVFHALFPPGADTTASSLAWVPVSLSILLVASTLLALGLFVLIPGLSRGVRRGLVALYAAVFAVVVLFVDDSYGTIVRFYAPTLILFLIAALRQAMRKTGPGWGLLAISFVISIAAAVLQQMRIGVHPDYLDHNALYHVLQGIALVLLFRGFARVNHAIGANSPARRG